MYYKKILVNRNSGIYVSVFSTLKNYSKNYAVEVLVFTSGEFMRLFKKRKKGMPIKELLLFSGKSISYAVERKNGEEITLGKSGAITVTEKEIVIVCNGVEVFRCKTNGAVIGTLMSGNGCDIKGTDKSGARRHIIAHYNAWK